MIAEMLHFCGALHWYYYIVITVILCYYTVNVQLRMTWVTATSQRVAKSLGNVREFHNALEWSLCIHVSYCEQLYIKHIIFTKKC